MFQQLGPNKIPEQQVLPNCLSFFALLWPTTSSKKSPQQNPEFVVEFIENTTVLRDSKLQRVKKETLVPGDIIFLHAGERIPADARVLAVTEHAEQNMSFLTREPDPQKVSTKKTNTNCLQR